MTLRKLAVRWAGSEVVLAIAGVVLASLALTSPAHAAAPEPVTPLQDVTTADRKVYDAKAHDATGPGSTGMDTAKIIANPNGGYLAVYHYLVDQNFQVRVATSTTLINWTFAAILEDAASQPTIAALSNDGFLVAYEKSWKSGNTCGGSGSCLGFEYFASESALLSGNADRSIVVNRKLSTCNEGTPNIYAATLDPDLDHSIINVGFHYFKGCDVDRQAVGTLTNFSSWRVQDDTTVNKLFTNLGTINGNVGDRDAFFHEGKAYSIIEAQSTKNDFRSWRPYLFDRAANTLTLLNLRTDADPPSTSFGNPTYTDLSLPDGRRGFVSTQFIFSEGAGAGEAGQLIYFKSFSPQPPDDTAPPTVSITQPQNGSKVKRFSAVSIKATASDPSGIAKVAFLVNGALVCVTPFAPYSCSWIVPSKVGVTYTIEARAFDTASNVSSSTVRVTASS
jgi:hypothetical protein